jgi:putative tricarboxylic transport membrane protein
LTTSEDHHEPESKEAGEVARLISYLIILAASAWLFFDARALPTSRWEVLGAGAFPQLVFATLALLAAAASVDTLRRLRGAAFAGFGAAASGWLRARYLVFALLALFGLYLAVLPRAGFSWSTFVFLLAAQFLLAPRRPVVLAVLVVLALLFSFGLNTLFDEVFNVFLPRGRWWA